MNLAASGGDPLASLLFVNFNQDCSSLAVGTQDGYRLYSLQNPDNLGQIYSFEGNNVRIIERLFSSSLVAVVSMSSPRKLRVCHFKKGSEICNYSYPNSIMGVRMNRERLVVVLEESMYIHNIENMKVIHTIRDTPRNPNGLCALSFSKDNNYLAYPGNENTGEVQIFDTVELTCALILPAHDSPLAALSFSADGKRLATASEKGTVIRIFSVPDGARLMELRRGMRRSASIYSLSFSPDGLYLASSSNYETVHIFNVDPQKEKGASSEAEKREADKKNEQQSWLSYFGSVVAAPTKLLPNQVSDPFNQVRGFAYAKLPAAGHRTVCAVASLDSKSPPRVFVACGDGILYVYTVNPVEGGECSLYKQHSLSSWQPGQREPTPEEMSSASAAGATGGLANLSLHTCDSFSSSGGSSPGVAAATATTTATGAAAAGSPLAAGGGGGGGAVRGDLPSAGTGFGFAGEHYAAADDADTPPDFPSS